MNPTILVGLDGATFSILDPLVENGTMPFLGEFMKQGVRAELLSTPNPLTPPAWTSMITGRSPGNHGVFDFIWAEQRGAEHYFTLYNFRDIRCETIWSTVSRQNGTATSLNFPMMSPPPAVAGSIVPGLVSWRHLRRNVHPRELYGELKEIPGFSARELAWDFDMEKNAAKGVPEQEYENWVDFHIRRERQWFEVARHLMRKHPTDLLAVLFDGPDKLLHMGWRFLHPGSFPKNPSSWELKIRDLCTLYFRELDGFIAEIVAMAGPSARVFMGSDHGFGPTWEVLRINTWLHEQGYLTWKNLSDLDAKGKQSAERLVENHFVLLDWEKTTAFARSTTSNGIYIRVAKESGEPGVPVAEYDGFRNGLIEKLEKIEDPVTGERIVTQIMKREDAFPGEHNSQAPDLTLVMRDRSFVSILNKDPVVCARPQVEGTHYPEGIFLARGPGIREGETLPQLSILDVAPALLYSLGLPIPCDYEGRFPSEVFTESLVGERPCEVGEMTQAPDGARREAGGREAVDEEEQAEIMKRLRALGYVE